MHLSRFIIGLGWLAAMPVALAADLLLTNGRVYTAVEAADIMEIPEAEILKARCVMTVIGGEVIHEAR